MSEKKNENGYKGRFREIAAVLHKHEISKGITPEKLRLILEDLGPTFRSVDVPEIRYFTEELL